MPLHGSRWASSFPGGMDLAEQLRSALQGSALAVMLYGSRARGEARPDSDVDILQLVESRPGSHSEGIINVASYTVAHLTVLAQQGSLFVRHLRDEGVILEDPQGLLAKILEAYRPPADYATLKREITITLAATNSIDSDEFARSLYKLAVYSTRTALYIRAAESRCLSFDIDKVSTEHGLPELPQLLRQGDWKHVARLREIGLLLLDTQPASDLPTDLGSLAIWARDQYPLAARLLEGCLAGEAKIDYTSLSLPSL